MLDFREEFKNNSLPKLDSVYDIKRFLAILYGSKSNSYYVDGDEDNPLWDVIPDSNHYYHILKSFKRVPSYMNPNNIKIIKTKYDDNLVIQEKTGLKRKFLIEISDSYVDVFTQTKPRQRLKDFERYKSYNIEEFM